MFKSILAPAVLVASIAAPASAQWVERGSIQDHAYRSGMYQSQINIARSMYYYETGYDGLAPSCQNPNARYIPVGGGLISEGYLLSLQDPGWSPTDPCIISPRPYGGGCFPGAGGGYNNIGWGVGVNAGVGGGYGSGYGGGRNYDYNNTNWGIGVNGGVGGNSGSWGGGGYNNLGWGVGVNGGVGGNSGSFRSW